VLCSCDSGIGIDIGVRGGMLAVHEEPGEGEPDDRRDTGANDLQGEVADGGGRRQAEDRREDEGGHRAATGCRDGPANSTAGETEVERPAQWQLTP